MKRIISFIGVLAMLLAVTACTRGVSPAVNTPTKAPATEAPATEVPATEVPATEVPATEVPTSEPTHQPEKVPFGDPVTGYVDYCVRLDGNEPFITDIDFDGLDDTVLFTVGELNEWGERTYKLTVTRGADPDDPAVYTAENAYDCTAWVVDTAVWDSRLDVIMTFVQDSNDWTTAAIRVSDSGTRIDKFVDYAQVVISDEVTFTSNLGFIFSRRSDVLGTRMLGAYFKIAADGFCPISNYQYPEDAEPLALKRGMTVTVFDGTGRPTEEVELNAGDWVIPVSTNLSNCVIFRLSDGRMAIVGLEIRDTDTEYTILINGIDQDEYFDLFYAD